MRQYYSESVLAQRIYGPPEIRFWAKVRRGGPDECWLWLAHRDTKGYGKFGITDAISKKAHRYAYELLVEPIPDGLTLDHLCRNRGCVNPTHLEPVTPIENIRRGESAQRNKTHCPQGHEYTPENTRFYVHSVRPSKIKGGIGRQCRICHKEHVRRSASKRKTS